MLTEDMCDGKRDTERLLSRRSPTTMISVSHLKLSEVVFSLMHAYFWKKFRHPDDNRIDVRPFLSPLIEMRDA